MPESQLTLFHTTTLPDLSRFPRSEVYFRQYPNYFVAPHIPQGNELLTMLKNRLKSMAIYLEWFPGVQVLFNFTLSSTHSSMEALDCPKEVSSGIVQQLNAALSSTMQNASWDGPKDWEVLNAELHGGCVALRGKLKANATDHIRLPPF